jgi:hypothetical protein
MEMKPTVSGLILIALLFQAPAAGALELAGSEAAFFEDGQCTGDYIKLGKGDYPAFSSLANPGRQGAPKEDWNDKVSCLLIGKKARVMVFEHNNFKGAGKTLRYTEKNQGKIIFAGSNWNDRISSAKVQSVSD